MSPFFLIFSLALSGYLCGSVPFGLILTRLAGLGDIRAIGSGNIGATNVLRTGNKTLAGATLLLDGLKGAAAIGLYEMFFSPSALREIPYVLSALLLGGGAVIGHVFPLWLKFRGGKGVATTLGVFLTAVPVAGVGACATWILVAAIFRYSSLAALGALAVAPVVTFLVYGAAPPAFLCLFMSTLVWARHTSNIRRLLSGQEPRIGQKN